MPQDSEPPVVSNDLPTVPLLNVGPAFAFETALAIGYTVGYELLDRATAGIPTAAIRVGDYISHTWLRRTQNPYLDEMDAVAAKVMRPGTYFFNVNYEWGCTTAAKSRADGQCTRLVRTLDWATNGLGRYVVAARVFSRAGPWVTLTWPGYTGVLQAMAPGRFAAAINQAPARIVWDVPALDWITAKRRVWWSNALPPAHLLRQVFEHATTYQAAKEKLKSTPITTPVIFTLAGVRPGEACVIERQERDARVFEGVEVASCSNDWQTAAWQARRRPGRWSDERLAAIRGMTVAPDFDRPFDWLVPPILNDQTRLIVLADPAEGRLVAQGYEEERPATAKLDVQF